MAIDKSLTDDILGSIGEGLFTVGKDFKINSFIKPLLLAVVP